MGLSTKQVSGDHGADWGQSLLQSGSLELPKPPTVRRQQPQQPPEPVACPRCSSTNTKFCYYNNYNKSQPRHYCKACKRHWTKGGTLRNVPVGGGRKNKRLKTSATSTKTSVGTTATVKRDTHVGDQIQQFSQEFYQTPGVQKNNPEALYEISPPGVCQIDSETSFSGNDSDFLGSFLQNQTPPFTFSSLSSFENNPCFRSFDCFNFTAEGLGSSMDETTITAITSTVGSDQSWQVPATIDSVMDPPSYWNWEDFEPLVMANELSSPDWDDSSEAKPQF